MTLETSAATAAQDQRQAAIGEAARHAEPRDGFGCPAATVAATADAPRRTPISGLCGGCSEITAPSSEAGRPPGDWSLCDSAG